MSEYLETSRGRAISAAKKRHGHKTRGRASHEYKTWESMCRRCHNPRQPSYATHGARGVAVCNEWRGPGGFDRFLAHVGPATEERRSIDRIDNARGYEPGNVRWATKVEQARNMSTNRMITIMGETRCVAAWSELSGVKQHTIAARIDRFGYHPEDAVFMPTGTRRQKHAHLAPDALHGKVRRAREGREDG